MNLVLTVLQTVAPVFLLAAIGYVWVRLGNEFRLEFVTRLTMTLSSPALIFTALVKTDIDPNALATITVAAVGAYALVGLAAYGAIRLTGRDVRTYVNPLTFGNTGNLGLPLALFAFGPTGLGYAVAIFAVMAVGSFTIGVWLVAGRGSFGKVLREPLVWSTLLGALFLWQGWSVPVFAMNTLDLLGQIAIPMMLITLGVAVARLKPAHIGPSVVMALGKLVLSCGAALAMGLLFGLEGVALSVLIVQICTPVAVTSYLLAEKYGADADATAGLVVASTMLSVLYLPVLLAFVM
ncbi:Membrane transport protein [Aquimixticola soesokkakensis]|uniref:Membrane transport protein n=1 Tax=Aquimixticola soesokkakensis TaxID=1519096 RepID=A0A1Y5TNY3_9RHOB|nr:AEC family transporter [Aquimixticola soesokkakensis]SLN68492.1 Membrane transport protein [Aquimixticola soesokkakensis]